MATRTITSEMQTASQDDVVRPFIAAEMDFSGGVTRVNSTPYDLTFGATGASPEETFTGVGQLGSISVVEEAAELQNYAIQLGLRGIPNDIISTSLNEDYQGRSCKVWAGLLDGEHAVIVEPLLVFDGLMDTMDTELGETAAIILTAQSRLSRWETPSNARYTNEEQQKRFPGDKGLEFIAEMVEVEVEWP